MPPSIEGGLTLGVEMKKILFILMLLLLFGMTFADTLDMYATEVNVIVDGIELNTFDEEQNIDLPAFTYNWRTMLPLKKTFSLFGIGDTQISWQQSDFSVTIVTNEGDDIWMQIDNPVMLVNGEEMVTDVPAKVFNNRTFIPVAFISEILGENPVWHNDTKTVTMNPSQYTIDAFQLTYYLDRKMGYTRPIYDADLGKYMIKRWDQSNNLYSEVIYLDRLEKKINQALLDLAEEMYLSTEDFKLLASEKICFYREMGNDNYTMLLQMNEQTLHLKVMGMTLDQIVDMVETMEVTQ